MLHVEGYNYVLTGYNYFNRNFLSELKDGRTPNGLANRLCYWKAEEYQKFSYPASEVLLSHLLQPDDYHLWQLTCRMTELVFNKRDGWSHDEAALFCILAKRFLILSEESMGITACTITAHNLLHVSEDAMRFSHPDNYWCFNFERAVKRYVAIPSNFKNFLCSYAKRESRRELLKVISAAIKPQRTRSEVPGKVNLEKVRVFNFKTSLTMHSTDE